MSTPLSVGIMGSSGGGAFIATDEILRAARPGAVRWSVVTDRACGLETYAQERLYPHLRVAGDNAACSTHAAAFFVAQRAAAVILFHSRLVTGELFERVATINVHPAALPAFPGLNALRQAVDAGAAEFGATIHMVDASVDGGSIIAQVRAPLPPVEFPVLEHFSFAQKVYLTLLVVDALSRGTLRVAAGAEPRWDAAARLAPDLAGGYAAFARREAVPVPA